MPHTVLVTGGAGFIGSHLVDGLSAEGHTVRIVDNFSTGFRSNVSPPRSNVSIIDADLAEESVAADACRDIEYVFHLAAIPSVPRSVHDPITTQRNGEVATLRLLEACASKSVRRVIFASSSSAYGDTQVLPKVETMLPQPLSPYAASKVACEHYLRAYAHCRGLDSVALRYFNVFGPRQNSASPYSGVISLFLARMLRGERPNIHGNGMQTRDFTYVENVVLANLLAMRAPGRLNGTICNIGCGQQVTLNAVVEALNAALETHLAPVYIPSRTGDVRDSLADITRARELLKYAPKIGFSDGIECLVVAQALQHD